MSQNIFGQIINIDTRFAQIIARVYNNKYNPARLYDIRVIKNKQDIQVDNVPYDPQNVSETDFRGQLDNKQNQILNINIINKNFITNNKLNENFNNKISDRNNKNANNLNQTIYTGQYNSKNYTRYIKTDLLRTTL